MAQRSNPLSHILDDNRLTGPNFSDWLKNLRIVLNLECIGYVLDSKIPSALFTGFYNPASAQIANK